MEDGTWRRHPRGSLHVNPLGLNDGLNVTSPIRLIIITIRRPNSSVFHDPGICYYLSDALSRTLASSLRDITAREDTKRHVVIDHFDMEGYYQK